MSERDLDRAFLRRCVAAYEVLVDRVERAKRDPERMLAWIRRAADFSMRHHPGRYADGRLENPLLALGRTLPGPPVPAPAAGADRVVLHVLSEVPAAGAGGHVRLLRHWIERDTGSRHHVAVTRQPAAVLPDWLAGHVVAAWSPERPVLERAAALRETASRVAPTLVVLHQHPEDTIPVLAFAHDGGPPVAAMNHADHIFWLGVSVTDAVFNYRVFGSRVSDTRRFGRRNLFLPVPLPSPPPTVPRSEARRQLGIPPDQAVLLAIGQRYKFVATPSHDFFRACRRLLAIAPSAHVYLVGYGEGPDVERMHGVPVQPDLASWFGAADVVLEGFPYGGYLATLEAAASGVAVVAMPRPRPQLVTTNDPAFEGIIDNPADEEAWCAEVAGLIADPARRTALGRELAASALATHHERWLEQLESGYAALAGIRHEPRVLAAEDARETEEDLDLAWFQRQGDDGAPFLEGIGPYELTAPELLGLWWAARRVEPTRPRVWLRRLRRRLRRRRRRTGGAGGSP